MPTSRDTTSSAALSGGSNLATALSLNACPYRAKSVLHRRPRGCSMEAATILTRGVLEKRSPAVNQIDSSSGTLGGVTHGVDTGFLVFNHATYPQLVKLFAQLQVDTAPSEMSFSVQVPRADGSPGLEWSGCNLDTVFAQRSNLVSPRFLGMLRDLLRFNRITSAIAERNEESALQQPIGDFLVQQGFSSTFRDWYLLPMAAAIWFLPASRMTLKSARKAILESIYS